jgi:hypothetical protein
MPRSGTYHMLPLTMHSHATQVNLLFAFLEWCSILCSTNSWAENRMVNEGLHLRFYCVQGNSMPVLFYIISITNRVFRIVVLLLHGVVELVKSVAPAVYSLDQRLEISPAHHANADWGCGVGVRYALNGMLSRPHGDEDRV